MKLHCDVIADLIPLYADRICSEQSKRLVEAHLQECEACRALIANIMPLPYFSMEPEIADSERAVKKGFQRIRMRWLTSIIAVFLVSVIFFTVWLRLQTNSDTQSYHTALSFMECLRDADYDGAYAQFNIASKKTDWLNCYFSEEQLQNMEADGLAIFRKYAKKVESKGGITDYEYVGVIPNASLKEDISIDEVLFRVQFDGDEQLLHVWVSQNGVEGFSTDQSFVTDPLTQLSIWSEYLWQQYEGCYYDPDIGKYIYENTK